MTDLLTDEKEKELKTIARRGLRQVASDLWRALMGGSREPLHPQSALSSINKPNSPHFIGGDNKKSIIAPTDITIPAHEGRNITTGLVFNVEGGTALVVTPISPRKPILNLTSDFITNDDGEVEIEISLYNFSDVEIVIKAGTRLARFDLVMTPFKGERE